MTELISCEWFQQNRVIFANTNLELNDISWTESNILGHSKLIAGFRHKHQSVVERAAVSREHPICNGQPDLFGERILDWFVIHLSNQIWFFTKRLSDNFIHE